MQMLKVQLQRIFLILHEGKQMCLYPLFIQNFNYSVALHLLDLAFVNAIVKYSACLPDSTWAAANMPELD